MTPDTYEQIATILDQPDDPAARLPLLTAAEARAVVALLREITDQPDISQHLAQGARVLSGRILRRIPST